MIDYSEFPKKIKQFNTAECTELCADVRKKIIDEVKRSGGHLSANLGVVELTVSLAKVFDFEKDKILFDVGHQSYTYKLLTGRENNFSSIRKLGGLSGFPSTSESEFDRFSTGHAGNTVALSLGFCEARDRLNEDFYVVDIVGDGAFANGLTLESMVGSDKKPSKFIVILNDNGMAISKNASAFYRAISKLTTRSSYYKLKQAIKKLLGSRGVIFRILAGIKDFIKRALNRNNMFDDWGFKYVGPIDGHDISELCQTLENAKQYKDGPVLIHVLTKKGKGFDVAEKDSIKYHGIGKDLCVGHNEFACSVSAIMEKSLESNDKVVAVTAAMTDGVGLTEFAKNHPDKVIDVGIAEGYGATLTAGMAKGGLRPFFFVYSTFLQRAYDQLVEEIALENLPVVLMIDRAGLVGADGKTHQGLYDIAMINSIPNFRLLAPKDTLELFDCVEYALTLNSPVAIRYPNGENKSFENKTKISDSDLWEVLQNGTSDTTILAVGGRMLDIALKAYNQSELKPTVINCRSIKPLDEKILSNIKTNHIITMEDGTINGGFGSEICKFYSNSDKSVKVMGVLDKFIPHASVNEQLDMCGLTVENVISQIL